MKNLHICTYGTVLERTCTAGWSSLALVPYPPLARGETRKSSPPTETRLSLVHAARPLSVVPRPTQGSGIGQLKLGRPRERERGVGGTLF